MHDSPLVQYLTEKTRVEAHQQGEKERALKDILEALTLRLHPDAALNFKPALENIDDLHHLDRLFRAAVQANNPEDFQQVLDANGN